MRVWKTGTKSQIISTVMCFDIQMELFLFGAGAYELSSGECDATCIRLCDVLSVSR
jgi:hypothetical protein